MEERKSLAWHETMELHELIAFQANCLMKLKKTVGEVSDPTLKSLYQESIVGLQQNLQELLPFFSNMEATREEIRALDTGFYAGDLLGAAKVSVRNYAIAVTETATLELGEVLMKHLQKAIRWHEKTYNFMYKRGYYPSYDLKKLLQNDVKNAQKAIKLQY